MVSYSTRNRIYYSRSAFRPQAERVVYRFIMKKNLSLTLQPSGQCIGVAPGTTVLHVLQKLGIPIRSDCGGIGVCGKCKVHSHDIDALSKPSQEELEVVDFPKPEEPYRLACQAEIVGEASIYIVDAAEDQSEPRGKNISTAEIRVNPAVKRSILKYDPVESKQNRDKSSLQNDNDVQTISPLIQHDLTRKRGEQTFVKHDIKGITAIIDGARPESFGMAVDLGTTTVAVYLCNLRDGKILASSAGINPQRSYGEDVISRIHACAGGKEVLLKLQEMVVSCINLLLKRCLEKCGGTAADIDEVVIVGNTTMQTIFAGLSPETLGRSPYLPATKHSQNVSAADIGLQINPGTNVYIFPVISGFLGGDAVGATLADDLLTAEKTSLIIDIGTNGELVLGNRNGLLATSCATGPALEGANISCGMRAANGAVSRVKLNRETLRPEYTTLGEEDGHKPVGLCGSGLIDAIAVMRMSGVLLASGRLREETEGVICDEMGIGQEYILVPAAESGTGKPITISLKDIRAFQLAKSALFVGIEKLMEQLGVTFVNRTVITGAFGNHFNWTNGVVLGLIPSSVTGGEVISAINLAGVGAMQALFDKNRRVQAEQIASNTISIDLAMDHDFNNRFVAGTIFPPLKN